ncbi:MAG: xylulokinase [Acidimicrobiales bacterium]|nr:xylulokinase [Acidimicrobiales bacterium]
MPLVAGVDSSTQSTKVELRDLDSGALVASGKAAHPAAEPPRSEQDPRAWWTAMVEAFAACGKQRADVVAIAVGGQQHGLVVLGADDEPLRPAKLWNDTESAPQAAALVDALGADAWANACGSVPVASFTITKLAWLIANEPALVDRIARVLLPHDYLTLRLTGEHVTDRGDASGGGWFDRATGGYREDLLALLGGRDDWAALLPRIAGPWETVGTVTDSAAVELGVPAGTPVGPGTGDNMAAALGLGLAPGDIAMSLGTSGTVYAVSPTPTADPTGAVAGFCDAAGGYLPLVCTLNATKVTDTVAGWLGHDHAAFAELALAAPPGADGVILTPYFDGERTPNLPDATGTFAGLRNSTTAADLARAAHEGVVRGLLHGVDALREAGASVDGTLHLIGGGARSAAYRAIVADLHGSAIRVPDADETVALGAAVQAARVVGGPDATTDWPLGVGEDVIPG